MEEGIYYKRGSKSDYIGVDVLPNGKDIPRVVIRNIKFHETLKVNGREERDMWTAEFDANPYFSKPMILNATCRKRIAKLFWDMAVADGTPCAGRINLLHGVAVRLTQESCRDLADGGTTYGLRISKIPADPEPQQEKKVLPADKVDAVISWAKGKNYSFADVVKFYEMSEDVAEKVREGLSNE